MLQAVVGINWGDEGKGRMVDLLSKNADIVVRYQGGNNAGHTVVNEKGKFILNLIPSGILRETTVNVMGNGMVIDLKHLVGEIEALKKGNIKITPENLKISDKASICMPYHVLMDCLEEDRLKDKKFGSTRRGIAPVYADKYMKKDLRFSDLFHKDTLKNKVADILEWKNITVKNGYHADEIKLDETLKYLETYGEILKPYVCDVGEYLFKGANEGKNIMFEAQLGALRDIDFGIYPYTSSSSTIASYACIGAGIPSKKLDNVVGIMKAYSSCVGEGPFVCEMFGDEGNALRLKGGEFGAATGRPRRVGGFDVPASSYGCKMQGADMLALTKLDILQDMAKIPVCVAYEIDGQIRTDFPCVDELYKAKPVIEYLEGWQQDISKARKIEDLPEKAINYIRFLEEKVNCPIKYVSVGFERDAYIEMF